MSGQAELGGSVGSHGWLWARTTCPSWFRNPAESVNCYKAKNLSGPSFGSELKPLLPSHELMARQKNPIRRLGAARLASPMEDVQWAKNSGINAGILSESTLPITYPCSRTFCTSNWKVGSSSCKKSQKLSSVVFTERKKPRKKISTWLVSVVQSTMRLRSTLLVCLPVQFIFLQPQRKWQ